MSSSRSCRPCFWRKSNSDRDDRNELGTNGEDQWVPGSMPDRPAGLRQVVHMQFAAEQSGGGDTDIRRPIGPFTREFWDPDPFIAFDDFTCALPDGFPDHAHRGFETLTYLVPSSPGSLTHEDHLGNVGTLHPGDAQWMTCGRGILHSEVPASDLFVRGLQLWINLPEEHKLMPPAYQEAPRALHQRVEVPGIKAILVSGEALGVEAAVHTQTFCQFVHVMMGPNAEFCQTVPTGYTAFLYTLTGVACYAGQTAGAHHLICLSNEEGQQGVLINTNNSDASFVVVAAHPVREPVVWQGPFVMCTEAQIRDSMLDYQVGRNGFEGVHDWQSQNRLRMTT